MKTALLTLLLVSATRVALASDLPSEVSSASEAMHWFDQESSVRVLNVWATWCAPCVAELPHLDRFDRDLGPLGLDVVGVSMDDVIPGQRDETRKKVARFLASRRISFANVYYTGKAHQIADELRFEGEIPVTLVFDRSGRELMRIEGAFESDALEARLRELLSTKR